MESLHVSQGSGQELHLETPTGQASGSQRPPARTSTSRSLGGAPAALKGKAEGLAPSRRPSNGPQVGTTVVISASAEVKKSMLSSEKYEWLLFLT